MGREAGLQMTFIPTFIVVLYNVTFWIAVLEISVKDEALFSTVLLSCNLARSGKSKKKKKIQDPKGSSKVSPRLVLILQLPYLWVEG